MLISSSGCSDDSTDCVSMDCLNIDYDSIDYDSTDCVSMDCLNIDYDSIDYDSMDYDSTDCNVANACCSDDSTDKQESSDKQENPLIGTWQLIEAKFYGLVGGTSSTGSIDYCGDSITYTFEQNGELKVDGKKDNVGHLLGQYQYEFGEFSLFSSQGVKINDSEWTYSLNNGIMVLGTSYVDGPDLHLKRKYIKGISKN